MSQGGNPEQAPASPDWLAAVVLQGGEALAVFDDDLCILFVNAAAAALLRNTPTELVGRTALDLVHADDLVRSAATVSSVGQGGRPRPGLIRMRRGDGTWGVVEVTLWRVDLAGAPGGPGPVTAVSLRDNTIHEAHWEFLAAITGGEPFHRCIEVLADTLSHDTDGPMGIAYDQDGTRFVAGPLAADLAGISSEGGLAEEPGTPWQRALASGRPVFGRTEDLAEPLRSRGLERGGPAYVVVPVPDPGNDRPALIVQWPTHESMAELLAEALANRALKAVTLALQRRETLRQLERQARRDGLTGLVNREHFFVVLDRLSARRRPFGVCYVDLDHFKPVNDTLGHLAGDHVLVACGRRIEAAVRDGDVVARLGGDEFAVACADVTVEELEGVAARIVDALKEPLLVSGHRVSTAASVGCAFGEADEVPDAVVAAADEALYAAKRAGRGTWQRSALAAAASPGS